MTSINQNTRVTEIHEPDGKNDLLQQVENGALSVVNSYLSLGRLYRGIICNNLRQYVLLGDAAAMTDGKKGNADDRWIFTENNPGREMQTAAQLAAISRVMKGFNDTLSVHCLNIAKEIFEAQNKETDANRGSQSATTAYGLNRADWSYIPGGVVSGTALIRPDFPELLEFPFLWQQTEYCLGGASSHYMFIALAAQHQWN